MKARKKPVVINYVPISFLLSKVVPETLLTTRPMIAWEELPMWVHQAYVADRIGLRKNGIIIKTKEGLMTGGLEDMLLQGVEGELYPCKSNIFAETYDLVTEEE